MRAPQYLSAMEAGWGGTEIKKFTKTFIHPFSILQNSNIDLEFSLIQTECIGSDITT
jgi:hypothetical protein